jgi:hypothetical protein
MQIVDIIRAHPDHEVIISVDTLGKEDLLLHISRALGTKVGASFFSRNTSCSTHPHKTLMGSFGKSFTCYFLVISMVQHNVL